MPSPEDKLRSQLETVKAIGQVATIMGEQVLCTDNTPEITHFTSNLSKAFVETDQLSKNLKLGPLRQVIIGNSNLPIQGSEQQANSHQNDNNEISIVQSIVASKPAPHIHDQIGDDFNDNDGSGSNSSDSQDVLITTTIAKGLTNALLGDKAIVTTSKNILTYV